MFLKESVERASPVSITCTYSAGVYL